MKHKHTSIDPLRDRSPLNEKNESPSGAFQRLGTAPLSRKHSGHNIIDDRLSGLVSAGLTTAAEGGPEKVPKSVLFITDARRQANATNFTALGGIAY